MNTCQLCNGQLVSLGVLGRLEHFRCRDCGIECSRAVAESPSWATDKCVACGHKLEDEGEHALCCSHASYDDGKHEDPYCKKCCGPHTPVNPQVEWFPQG